MRSVASRSSSHQGSARISSPSSAAAGQSSSRSSMRSRRSRAGWRWLSAYNCAANSPLPQALDIPRHAIAQAVPAPRLEELHLLPGQLAGKRHQRLGIPALPQLIPAIAQGRTGQVFLHGRALHKQAMLAVEHIRVVTGDTEVTQHEIGQALAPVAEKQQLKQRHLSQAAGR